MTPQSSFMVIAPVIAEREAPMNVTPGHADPHNRLVPFEDFVSSDFRVHRVQRTS